MITTWLPSSIPAVVTTKGALWGIGPVTRTHPPERMRTRAPSPPTFSNRAGAVAAISFGRPVLPPLVTIFHSGDTPGVNEPAGSCEGTDSMVGRAPASACGIPTTRDGFARSTMAERSRGGSRSEIGCGTAPTAQAADMLSTSPMELGRPMVTVEPAATPRLANSAARRSTRCTNPARVSVTSPHVSAGRSGSASASWRRTEKKVVPSTFTEPTPQRRRQRGHQWSAQRPRPDRPGSAARRRGGCHGDAP